MNREKWNRWWQFGGLPTSDTVTLFDISLSFLPLPAEHTGENTLLNLLFPVCLEDCGIFLFACFLLLFPSEMTHKCYIISPYADCFP